MVELRWTRRELLTRGLRYGGVALALPAAAAILDACGGAAPVTGGATASGGGAAAAVLTIANSAEISGLDPHVRNPVETAMVTGQIFQTLFRIGPHASLEGVLATDYRNVDPTTWEFKLRQGVTFSDGTPWNAQAFIVNVQRMFSPTVPSNASSVIPLVLPDRIEAVDDHTVRVHTKAPDAVLPHRFAAYFVSFASPQVIKDHDAAYIQAHPVGTGPYRFQEWKKDDHLTLVARPDYWGPKPTVAQLVFRPIVDPQARVSALVTGQVDLARVIPTEAIPQVKGNPGTTIVTLPSGIQEFMVFLDARRPGPLADPTVRLALNYAVDRDSIINKILAGQAHPIQSIVTPQSFGYDASLQPYGYDPAKAKALLAQAGFGSGFATDLWYAPGSAPNDSEVVQALQGQLAQVGVQTSIKTADFATFITQILQGKLTGMFYVGKTNLIMDADYIFNDLSAGAPFGQYDPLAGDEVTLWHQEQQAFDPAQRAQLAARIQELLYQKPRWIYLYQMNDIYGVRNRVQGWQPRPDELLDFQGVTLKG